MSKCTRFWMAACVAGLALAPASRAGAGEKTAQLKLVSSALPSGSARAEKALGALQAAIGSMQQRGRATPDDIDAAKQAIDQAKSAVWALPDADAIALADALEKAMAPNGVPGTKHAAAAGKVTWAVQEGQALHVRLGLGDGVFGQPEAVIVGGLRPVILLRTGTWEMRRGERLSGEALAAQRHVKQTVVFASRRSTPNLERTIVRRVPGHVSVVRER